VRTLYNLGNGLEPQSDPNHVMEHYIGQEFPDIHEMLTEGNPHEVKFVPASFLYGNLTEQV